MRLVAASPVLPHSGILNNATLVYFILKLKNPWCDRPLKIKPLELAIEWDIPESSIYEAIDKLKEAEVIDIDQAEITIRWTGHSQQADPFWESRIDSEKSEPVLENQNEFQESRIDSEKSEKRSPEPLSEGDRRSPQISSYSSHTSSLSEAEREIQKNEIDPRFREWLHRKALRLPTKPEFIEQWIESQAQQESVQREFQLSQVGSERATVPPPAAPPQNLQPEPVFMTQQERLAKYLALWQTPLLRHTVTEQIQAHPDWGLTVTDDGPTIVQEEVTV